MARAKSHLKLLIEQLKYKMFRDAEKCNYLIWTLPLDLVILIADLIFKKIIVKPLNLLFHVKS